MPASMWGVELGGRRGGWRARGGATVSCVSYSHQKSAAVSLSTIKTTVVAVFSSAVTDERIFSFTERRFAPFSALWHRRVSRSLVTSAGLFPNIFSHQHLALTVSRYALRLYAFLMFSLPRRAWERWGLVARLRGAHQSSFHSSRYCTCMWCFDFSEALEWSGNGLWRSAQTYSVNSTLPAAQWLWESLHS